MLVPILVFFAAIGHAQGDGATSVTLWQFGRPRLLSGQITLAMEPLGTTIDAEGSATTYRYQVLNPATIATTNEAGLTFQTIPSATPRTIVASASGWVEYFPTHGIACNFIDSAFGQCVDDLPSTTNIANSGIPTPVVLSVGVPTIPTSMAPTPTIPEITQHVSNSVSAPTAIQAPVSGTASRTSAGAVAGATIAGCVLLLIGLALVIIWYRHRLRRVENVGVPKKYDLTKGTTEIGGEPPFSYESTSRLEAGTWRPPFPLAVFRGEKFQHPPLAGASAMSYTNSRGAPESLNSVYPPSEVSTRALARELLQRMHTNEVRGDLKAPVYLGSSKNQLNH